MARTKTPTGILIVGGVLSFALFALAAFVTIYDPPGEGWERLSNWLLAGIGVVFLVSVLRRRGTLTRTDCSERGYSTV